MVIHKDLQYNIETWLFDYHIYKQRDFPGKKKPTYWPGNLDSFSGNNWTFYQWNAKTGNHHGKHFREMHTHGKKENIDESTGVNMSCILIQSTIWALHAFNSELLLCFLKKSWCHKLGIVLDKTPPKICERDGGSVRNSMRIYKSPVRWEVIYLKEHGQASSDNHHPQLPAWRMMGSTSPNCPYKKLSNAHCRAHFQVQTCKTRITLLPTDKNPTTTPQQTES